jgi:hypothetical protein
VAIEPPLRDRLLAAQPAVSVARLGGAPLVDLGAAPGAGACAALAVLRLACAG